MLERAIVVYHRFRNSIQPYKGKVTGFLRNHLSRWVHRGTFFSCNKLQEIKQNQLVVGERTKENVAPRPHCCSWERAVACWFELLRCLPSLVLDQVVRRECGRDTKKTVRWQGGIKGWRDRGKEEKCDRKCPTALIQDQTQHCGVRGHVLSGTQRTAVLDKRSLQIG